MKRLNGMLAIALLVVLLAACGGAAPVKPAPKLALAAGVGVDPRVVAAQLPNGAVIDLMPESDGTNQFGPTIAAKVVNSETGETHVWLPRTTPQGLVDQWGSNGLAQEYVLRQLLALPQTSVSVDTNGWATEPQATYNMLSDTTISRTLDLPAGGWVAQTAMIVGFEQANKTNVLAWSHAVDQVTATNAQVTESNNGTIKFVVGAFVAADTVKALSHDQGRSWDATMIMMAGAWPWLAIGGVVLLYLMLRFGGKGGG